MNTLAARRRAELTNSGHEIITEVLFQKLKSQQNITSAPLKKDQNDRANDDLAKEPFGFADGISQPIIRGTRRYTRIRDAIHVVEPGEFILGYPDNRGRIPPSPAVGARRDPNHLLPGYGADPFRSRPDFSTPQPTGERDFGRNGTFLVVRQLSQDVDAFSEFLTRTARRLKRQHKAMAVKSTDERREWIRAKLVGRWPDGTSLVRFPTEPGTGRGRSARPDNDFLYRQDDPDGRRCPLGAHIRRANPRDSLASSNGETKVANRHRILRVGRPYADNVDDKMARGLFFMCLNADIERQFEFVQQSWVGLPTFHGLENETDCFAPRGQTTVFTVPTEKGPICLERLENFVKVIGGGYFFMPSQRALGYLASVAAAKSAPVCKPAQSEALSEAEA